MSEKTEEPTAHKLREARKKGQVAHSREVIGVAAFVALLILGWVSAKWALDYLLKSMESVLNMAWSQPPADATGVMPSVEIGLRSVLVLAVVAQVTAAVAAILAGATQARGVFSFDPMMPKFERLNPAAGIKRLFSTRQFFELVKVSLKIGALGTAIFVLVHDSLPAAIQSVYAAPVEISRTAGRMLFFTFAMCAVVYVVTAAVDYLHQYYEFIKDQRMSKEDVRQEHKNLEGDPTIKSQRKSIARQVAFSTQATSARMASVLVTNPTHFAVALYYKKGETPLPLVVDKAVDDAAIEMRRLARRQGIPIFEHRKLARRLHRQAPVDAFIPAELVDEVALVFKWVQQLNASGGMAATGASSNERRS